MGITLLGLARLANRALQSGGSYIEGFNALEWDVGAYCDQPIARSLHARDYKRGVMLKHKTTVNPGALSVHLAGLPCRKCTKCRFIKRCLWTDRILREMSTAGRNWFVTLTLSPEEQHRVFMEEIARLNSRGWRDSDFNDATSEWRLRCNGVGRELTKYLKRVRKPLAGETNVELRYVAMFEPHENGLPHLHLIMGERAGSLTYRRICDRWEALGFADASLVKEPVKAGRYVAKYITKHEQTRVRASQRYGELPSASELVRAEQAFAALYGLADPSEDMSVTPTEKGASLPKGLRNPVSQPVL